MTAAAKAKILPAYRAKVEWIRVGDIFVEPGTQRSLDEGWAQKIAALFDADLFGIPALVALPTDAGSERLDVIDGQHRVKAVRLKFGPDHLILCEVIRGVSKARAAAIYRGRNSIRRPRPLDSFLTGVTAGDHDCVAINDLVRSLGLQVYGTSQTGCISAVATLQRIYQDERRLGVKAPGLLRRTLELALSAWGREGEAFNGDLLRGLGMVLARYGGAIELDALEKKLRTVTGGALGLLGKARGVKQNLGGSTAQGVARVVVNAYNSGRRKSLLPEWGAHMEEPKGDPKKAA